MKYAILGGSFDPIHIGHLILAEACRERYKLDRVLFVPTGVSPHKKSHHATAEHRLAMLELALAPCEHFTVSRHEIERTETSFTVDTLRYFHEVMPGTELYLIVGADMLADIPNWREPSAICSLVTILTAHRAGFGTPYFDALAACATSEQLERCRQNVVAMPQIGISSSMIRERIAQQQSIRFLTPRAVESYIEHHKLYLER